MLDTVMVKRGNSRHPLHTEAYKPQQAMLNSGREKTRLLNPSGKELVAIFPSWHNGGSGILATRLAMQGKAVLDIRLHGEILKADVDQVKESFAQAQAGTVEKINYYMMTGKYKKLRLIGMSLGTVSMALAASALDRFDAATFVVGCADLAQSTWNGIRTELIREEFESDGVTYDQLSAAWAGLAPASHVESFNGVPTRLIVSRSDEIIPAADQFNLVNAMNEAAANVSTYETDKGHYATVLNYCLGSIR